GRARGRGAHGVRAVLHPAAVGDRARRGAVQAVPRRPAVPADHTAAADPVAEDPAQHRGPGPAAGPANRHLVRGAAGTGGDPARAAQPPAGGEAGAPAPARMAGRRAGHAAAAARLPEAGGGRAGRTGDALRGPAPARRHQPCRATADGVRHPRRRPAGRGHAAPRARGRRPELAVHPAPCLDRRARRRLGLHRRLAALTPRPGPPHRARMTDPLAILYADAHIAVVDKPAGVIVHESRLAGAETDTLVARVRAELGRPAWLAHRLDRATSGCLLLGLDRALMASLGAGFMERQVDKRY